MLVCTHKTWCSHPEVVVMALSDMLLFNVFVQVNTIQGYQYLDDAGKIMNVFDKDFPQK